MSLVLSSVTAMQLCAGCTVEFEPRLHWVRQRTPQALASSQKFCV